jgi:hypothetical protein
VLHGGKEYMISVGKQAFDNQVKGICDTGCKYYLFGKRYIKKRSQGRTCFIYHPGCVKGSLVTAPARIAAYITQI